LPKIKHADVKVMTTRAKTLGRDVTVIIMYHGILDKISWPYLTQCFCTTVLLQL